MSRSHLSRSGVEPPTGKLHPRQISACDSEFGKTSAEINFLIDSYFLSVVPLLSRGWIVPVGGATPDRLRGLNDSAEFCARDDAKKKCPAFG